MANGIDSIEEIIEELEEYIEGCKPVAFSSSKIVVNRDEIEVLISDLKTKTPDVINKCQKMISNKETILADAYRKADSIIQQAQIQTTELLSEHQIMQQAYVKANEVVLIANKEAQEIIDSATRKANEIEQGAITYTDDLLKMLHEIMIRSMETTRNRMDSYLQTMQGYVDIITQNRIELSPTAVAAESVNEPTDTPVVTNRVETENAQSPSNVEAVHTEAQTQIEDEQLEEFVDTLQEEPIATFPEKFFKKD